jgi:hypothetical protein
VSDDPGLDDLLAELWQQNRDAVLERLRLVMSAVGAIAEGASPADDEREAAVVAAHKLAGALGTYGFPEGSAVASRAESALLGDDGAGIDVLVADLVDVERALTGPYPPAA